MTKITMSMILGVGAIMVAMFSVAASNADGLFLAMLFLLASCVSS